MFQSDELIYIQLQKTASSHIAKLLAKLFDGQIIGKHNKPSTAQLTTAPYVLGSIRNPWDWYLSLWAFGVGGNGLILEILTQKKSKKAFKNWLKNPISGYKSLMTTLQKDVELWRRVYTNSEDVSAFRTWLNLIHQTEHCQILPQVINPNFGLMTNRYVSLYCSNETELLNISQNISQSKCLQQFDKKSCYVDYFIRQENLEQSLFEAIAPIKTLSKLEKSYILNTQKTNTSNKALALTDYYDKSSIDLIYQRDSLIIDKFNYLPPNK